MAKSTGKKIADILKDTKSGTTKTSNKRSGPSKRTKVSTAAYTGPRLRPKIGGPKKPKTLSDTHREVAEERKRNKGENKPKRTGHSRYGRGGGYADIYSHPKLGRRRIGIRREPKL